MKPAFGSVKEAVSALYSDEERQLERYAALAEKFAEQHGDVKDAVYFSAPGRIEICGNHTDHQGGKVLTAAIGHDILALASKNERSQLRINSVGQKVFTVNAGDTAMRKNEFGKSAGMVRGITAGFLHSGGKTGGADVCIMSDVPTGSGISSSAAFETLIAGVINNFYNDGSFSPIQIAKIGQYAESKYFGKPCGLMDQCASAYGGCIGIDFANDDSAIEPVSMKCVMENYEVFIIHGGGSHAKLGREYSSIVEEMHRVASHFGGKRLADVAEDEFFKNLNDVRNLYGDRAALRGMHYFGENARVDEAKKALSHHDTDTFLDVINASGESSALLLQNVYLDHVQNKSIALSLALTKKFFRDKGIKGACRIHGGGFLGTTLSFVPHMAAKEYKEYMESVFGQGSADIVKIREMGACAVAAIDN